REPIVNILYQRGLFDYHATRGTAEALLFYSMAIWAVCGVRIVTASFYSMQDTKTPMKIGMATLIINIILSFLLLKPMKHSGLALAYAVASTVNFSLLFIMLREKLGRVDGKNIISSFLKISTASLIMGFIARLIIRGDMWIESGKTIHKAGILGGVIALCFALYLLIMYLLRSEELKQIIKMIKDRKI
ncbi:MAG: lipid II flippase MurJ, partial [Nitrospirota bacterium]